MAYKYTKPVNIIDRKNLTETKQIRVFHTHTEIYPYSPGENPGFEKYLSVWIDAEYRYDPIGLFLHDDTLYIPRGIDEFSLMRAFGSTPFIVKLPDQYEMVYSIEMTESPRDRIQEDSLAFLLGKGKFRMNQMASQQALLLDTGDGKTFTTINAIIELGMKALIITHIDSIKNQWIDSFLKYTNIEEESLLEIHGTEMMEAIIDGHYKNKDYFFMNHKTISVFAATHGWPRLREFFKALKVGIKVYDEAHKEFRSILKIDMFSNTKKTFYLTANFGRSDTREGNLFKKCFASVSRFGEETRDYEEKRKHIIYVPVIYKSNPNLNQLAKAKNSYGFSVLGFSQYALHEDPLNSQLNRFYDVFDITQKLEGKVLITVPKIDDTEYLYNLVKKYIGESKKTISTIHSRHTKLENLDARDSDIIISTIKSCGTGVDIKGLRCIINLEPFSSDITSNQLSGRLREYAKDKDTYFFDLIDFAFPSCERQYRQKIKFLKKKCKEVRIMKY